MPKKVTIVSGIALVLLAALIAVLIGAGGSKPFETPRRVSVYFPESSEIMMMSYGEFLAGCVDGLLWNGTVADEALTAVAAAMNSRAMYALSTKSGFQNFGADFTVGEDFPFTAAEERDDRITQAVSDAEKMLLTYEGEPINAQMCVISTGRTDDCSPISPSTALACDIGAKGFESSTACTTTEVMTALHRGSLTSSCDEWFSEPVYAENGTLLYISFCDQRVTGAALKKALGLRSTAITVRFAEDKFFFTCIGLGDNRGMSINAADFYAKNGSTAEEILEIFYPGAKLITQ